MGNLRGRPGQPARRLREPRWLCTVSECSRKPPRASKECQDLVCTCQDHCGGIVSAGLLQEESVISLQTFQRRRFLQGELQGKELLGQARGQQTDREGPKPPYFPFATGKSEASGARERKGGAGESHKCLALWTGVCSQQRAPSPLPEVSEQLGAYCLSGTTSQRGGQSPARVALRSLHLLGCCWTDHRCVDSSEGHQGRKAYFSHSSGHHQPRG